MAWPLVEELFFAASLTCVAMINAFQDTFCYTLHLYKRHYLSLCLSVCSHSDWRIWGEGVARGRGEKGSLSVTDTHTYIQTDPPMKRVLEEHSLLKKDLFFVCRGGFRISARGGARF